MQQYKWSALPFSVLIAKKSVLHHRRLFQALHIDKVQGDLQIRLWYAIVKIIAQNIQLNTTLLTCTLKASFSLNKDFVPWRNHGKKNISPTSAMKIRMLLHAQTRFNTRAVLQEELHRDCDQTDYTPTLLWNIIVNELFAPQLQLLEQVFIIFSHYNVHIGRSVIDKTRYQQIGISKSSLSALQKTLPKIDSRTPDGRLTHYYVYHQSLDNRGVVTGTPLIRFSIEIFQAAAGWPPEDTAQVIIYKATEDLPILPERQNFGQLQNRRLLSQESWRAVHNPEGYVAYRVPFDANGMQLLVRKPPWPHAHWQT